MQRRQPSLDVTCDVFQDDDGVIDHEAGRDRQRHQRQIIEAVADQVHGAEGGDQRHRDRDDGDKRGPQVPQEREDHDDHQQHGEDQGALDVAQRGADGRRTVDAQCDIDGRRNGCPELRQQCLYEIDGRDDVGAWLPVQDDQNCRLAIGKPGVAEILHPIGDFADIRKMHRRAVAVSHDQRLVVDGLVGLVVGVDLVSLIADVDAAFRAVRIGAGERRSHVLKADAVFVEGLRNQVDPDHRQRTAAYDDLADSFDLREFLREHGRGGIIEFAACRGIGGQGQDQDRRVGGIDLAVGRVGPQAGRKVGTGRIDCGLHVARRAVDVAIQPELQRNARAAYRARGGHLGYICNLSEMTLERACNRRCDILWARARQARLHRNRREIHLRQRRDRQLEERYRSCCGEPERQQRRCDRPANEGC